MKELPKLPKPVVGWIYNHSRKNFWRFASWYEIDDLIQDGLMCAYKCVERYGVPGQDIDEPHFMKLVQSTFHNYIGDCLRRKRNVDDITTKFMDLGANGTSMKGLDSSTETNVLERCMVIENPEQEFFQLISELPKTLRNVVLLYLKDETAAEMRKKPREILQSRYSGFSDKLQKLTGFPADKDFETELRSYIWERDAGLI